MSCDGRTVGSQGLGWTVDRAPRACGSVTAVGRVMESRVLVS